MTTRKPSSRRSEHPIGKGWTDEILRGVLIPVADLGEELRHRAALCAAGLALRHPCTARRHPRRACAHPRHAEDRERLRVLLDGLGLLPEPEQTEPEPEPEPEQPTKRPTFPTDWSWAYQAACRGEDTELFYAPDADSVAAAKEICRLCPVALPCLDRALLHNEFGVWGGKAEGERSRRDRQKAIARALERAQQQYGEELAS